MKIGIDARLYGPQSRGIGRYVEKLIKNLEIIDKTNEYFIFLDRDSYDLYQPSNPNFKKVSADFRVYGWQEQVLFPFLILKNSIDLMHFPHFNVPLLYPGKFLVTIHDLIISHYPESRATTLSPWLYRLKLIIYQMTIRKAVKGAKKIITVSEFSKQDIIEQFKIKKEKITVAYEGVDLSDLPEKLSENNDLSKYGIEGDYLLYIGSAYPHKNLENLCLAFNELTNKDKFKELKLVLGGKNTIFHERLISYIKEISPEGELMKKIILPGFIEDSDLPLIYLKAKLYVFPSLIEGFGLPPLEAQTYGTPVVASNSSCLPEILGDSALYFKPESYLDMAEKISLALENEDLREKLIENAKENLKNFSWRKMAETIHANYKKD